MEFSEAGVEFKDKLVESRDKGMIGFRCRMVEFKANREEL